MKNLINSVNSISQQEIKDFQITEIFLIDGELYTTSGYDLPLEMINRIENELK